MGIFNKSLNEQELYIYERFRNQANAKWCNIDGEETDDAFYHANRYLLKDLRNLKICRKCFALYGTMAYKDFGICNCFSVEPGMPLYGTYTLKNHQKVYQQCHCNKTQEKNWAGYDFNMKYELCWCCGLEIIPSGSKFSSFYCRDCKERIWYLNQKLGRCVIPFGRHSVMNGVIGTGKDIGNKEAIDSFCKDVGGMNDRIAFLHDEYKGKKVKEAVDLLKLPEDSRAIDLFKNTKNADIARLKEQAFIDLLIEVMVGFIPLRQLSLN